MKKFCILTIWIYIWLLNITRIEASVSDINGTQWLTIINSSIYGAHVNDSLGNSFKIPRFSCKQILVPSGIETVDFSMDFDLVYNNINPESYSFPNHQIALEGRERLLHHLHRSGFEEEDVEDFRSNYCKLGVPRPGYFYNFSPCILNIGSFALESVCLKASKKAADDNKFYRSILISSVGTSIISTSYLYISHKITRSRLKKERENHQTNYKWTWDSKKDKGINIFDIKGPCGIRNGNILRKLKCSMEGCGAKSKKDL